MTDQPKRTPKSRYDFHGVGQIRTAFQTVKQCVRSGRSNPDTCVIEVFPAYADALLNLSMASHFWVLYWLDQSDRSALVRQARPGQKARGVFVSRSPNRPNPIGLSAVELIHQEGRFVTVSGLDCLDGTPLLDLKPFVPLDDAKPTAQIAWQP